MVFQSDIFSICSLSTLSTLPTLSSDYSVPVLPLSSVLSLASVATGSFGSIVSFGFSGSNTLVVYGVGGSSYRVRSDFGVDGVGREEEGEDMMEIGWKFGDGEYLNVDWLVGYMEVDISPMPHHCDSNEGVSSLLLHTKKTDFIVYKY